jgi:hypothetical protein
MPPSLAVLRLPSSLCQPEIELVAARQHEFADADAQVDAFGTAAEREQHAALAQDLTNSG